MTCRTPKRTIGLFVLVCLLLLGVCLENVQTDSLSACISLDLSGSLSAHPESVITSAQKTSPVRQFVPGKSSSTPEAVVNTRRSFGKTYRRLNRLGYDFLCTFHALLQNNSFIHSFFTHGVSFNLPNHIIIIRYIHLQDGQKSDFLFLN